jgi:hypothetical protein
MLAAWLLRFQWTFQPPVNRIAHKPGAFSAEQMCAEIFRERESLSRHPRMFTGTVYLDKFTDQPDIFFHLPCERLHALHHLLFCPFQT